MNNYSVKIIQDEQLVCEGFGQGNSACEALEYSLNTGTVYLPKQQDGCIALVCNNQGFVFRFEIAQIH